jgi:hypothetical protein
MAHLALYRLVGAEGYLLEVQANLLATLSTTMVVPLLPQNTTPRPMGRLRAGLV